MKRFLMIAVLAAAPSWAMACDTFTSVEFKPGTRTITYSGDWDGGFVLHDNGKDRHFSFADAGTGTQTIVGVPDDKADDAAQIQTPKGSFWLGPERFVEYCE